MRPFLPVEGVSVIWGNNLAGAPVWGDASPSLVVCPDPATSGPPDHCEQCFPDVFSACVVPRSMSCAVPPGRDGDGSAAQLEKSVPLLGLRKLATLAKYRQDTLALLITVSDKVILQFAVVMNIPNSTSLQQQLHSKPCFKLSQVFRFVLGEMVPTNV